MTSEINKQLNKISSPWFIDKCYFIGRVEVIHVFKEYSADLCIAPVYGHDIIKFNVPKCPQTGELQYQLAVDNAIKYLTPFRVFLLNVKTFFCYIKSML